MLVLIVADGDGGGVGDRWYMEYCDKAGQVPGDSIEGLVLRPRLVCADDADVDWHLQDLP